MLPSLCDFFCCFVKTMYQYINVTGYITTTVYCDHYITIWVLQLYQKQRVVNLWQYRDYITILLYY